MITRVARATTADVIIVRDLPLAVTAIRVGRKLRIPVIVDMAENYPAMVADIWHSGRQRRLDFLVRNPTLVALVEKWVIRNADGLIVVVEESREAIRAKGACADRITVVSNTPDLDRFPEGLARTNRHGEAPVRLVYLGQMEIPRGIYELILAVADLRSRGFDVRLDLIGDGRDRHEFQQMADHLSLLDNVVFHGHQPLSHALSIVKQADIGIVPHHVSEHTNTTIPNKLFDYMALSLPVVVSDSVPMKRIVEYENCGEVFAGGDARSLTNAVIRLMSLDKRLEAGRCGRAAVVGRFNWDVDSAALLSTVHYLIQNTKTH